MHQLSTTEAVRILELDGRIDPPAVKAAYRRLARQHHPDRGGDPATFHQVQSAYDTLCQALPHLRASRAPVDPSRAASVMQRWWESPTGFHEDQVGVDQLDWDAPVPQTVPFRVDRDTLARMLDASEGGGSVRPVTIHSRGPGSRLHRIISWLQPDLLSEVRMAPAAATGEAGGTGISGHDIAVRMRFPQMRARRIAGDAALPHGWVTHRTSSSVRVTRTLHPSVDPRATALRVADLVDEALTAMAWPLTDWFVVAG